MEKHFQFADFIEEFKVEFTALVEQEGRYDEKGKWIPGGTVPEIMKGIILPLTRDELQYESNGTYTSKDRKLYTLEPLKEGQKIEYKGQKYTIDTSKPYEDYADVYIYFAKGVGT